MASVSEIIRDHEEDIMTSWLEEARAAASARGLSTVALANVMTMYLSALADDSEPGISDGDDTRRKHVNRHVAARLRQGFELAEIVHEFVLLDRSISRMWWGQPPERWPSPPDIERLHRHIQIAIEEAADTFYEHMLADEQSDKRFQRQLQTIASAGLRDAEAPLQDRLREVLDVATEAMGAQCAAFLAYDVSEMKLVLSAGTGAAALEPYARSLDPRSFAEILANEEPTSMTDAASTLLEVPESLRRSGIRSLLGARLPPGTGLLGVMFVGYSDPREFTSRELNRIVVLAERIAVHLENAHLFAQLHAKIDALAIETALRERFVSALAHDLRGPLSVARLAADLLASKPETLDARRELAIKIEHNIERVDRMICDLLDASRIRSGEPLPLRVDRFDLVGLVEHVAEEARALHGDRFVVDAEESVVGAWSRDELHRALWNLVTNAVKYGAPKEPITIAIRHDGNSVRISVHNEGRAIPRNEQAHIFDAYARASTAEVRGARGWGLGLTLVRGAAEAHGGHVTVSSEPGSGTTFTIELPLDARTTADGLPTTVH